MTLAEDYAATPTTLKTPLGEDALFLKSLKGTETLSKPFQFDLDMVSEIHDLDFTAVVDQPVTVGLQLAGGGERFINGICTRFGHGGLDEELVRYHAELRPWFWKLTLASDCRIFQNLSTPDIIETLFGELGFSDYKLSLQGSYIKREYCVQYMETAFDFVSRLMEDDGVFYFFEHEDGKHTMVLADDLSAHQPCPVKDLIDYRPSPNPVARYGSIPICAFQQQVVTGSHAYKDYNFEKPADPLLATAQGEGAPLERYEYPGGYVEPSVGDIRAKLRIEEWETPGKVLAGPSYAPTFCAGYKFTLQNHPRPDMNAAYVLHSVTHQATPDRYSNHFTAFPEDVLFRPPRITPKARIFGAQTAVVVGKAGEEIWTDQYGRVKVQFHWDRLGKMDEESSCWIRVSQGWAGKQWGRFFLPRIGQEVVVSHLDGDPDRPLVTGAVYNAVQTTPYPLPAEQTKSTIKSDSSKGGGGFNELRFEDKKDSEEVFFHAQKDMLVKVLNNRDKFVLNDETITVTQNRTATIEEGNESLTVSKGDRTIEIATGKETYSVKATRDVTVGDNETHINEADFTQEVAGNYTLKVTGDIAIEAGGSITFKAGTSVDGEAGTDFTLKAGANYTAEAGVNMTNKASVNMNNEAGVALTNKGSASQTVDGGAMLTCKAGIVKIN